MSRSLPRAARAAEVIGRHLGWDASRAQADIDAYCRYVQRFALPAPAAPPPAAG